MPSLLLAQILAAAVLPLAASPAPPAPSLLRQQPSRAGLWVGDVVIDGVSRAKDFAPTAVEPTADRLRQRILLHVDADGRVRLLRSVAVVWDAAGGTGLFTDRAALDALLAGPAGDELVVERLETAAYDLPGRELTREEREAAGLDPERTAIEYRTELVLDGALAPGATVAAGAVDLAEGGPTPETEGLVLEVWHRSNPFRHPFHRAHATGNRITRSLELAVDAEPSEEALAAKVAGVDVLSAGYRERVFGLLKPGASILMHGRAVLHRVSTVDALDAFAPEQGEDR